MITFNGLPLYSVTLASEGDGVLRVSLVDDPAVCSDFAYFSKQKAPALYAVQDEEKRLVRGVVLRADYPIYRKDSPEDPGYYVTFGAATIRQIAERYLADGRQNAVDTAHDGKEVEDVQMVQFFIKDSAAGIDPEGFENIADGSLFAEYHVTNDEIWAEIKAGTFKGFSVEIFYTLIPAGGRMAREDDGEAVVRLLTSILSHCTDMIKLAQIRADLAKVLAKFGSVTTDKGVIQWDGDEDLKEGDRVYIAQEDGTRKDAEDGDYVTADNKTIVVVDGAVSEIRDPEAQVASDEGNNQEESAELRRFKAIRAAFDESYDEKMQKIVAAIYAARSNDDGWYLVDAGDDFAVICTWSDERGEVYVRYAITWNEDGTANASDPEEVKPAFVPKDEPAASPAPAEDAPTEEEFAQAVQAAADLKAENATLKARIAELEKEPAAKPVGAKFNAKPAKTKGTPETGALISESTGDRGLDRLARFNRK